MNDKIKAILEGEDVMSVISEKANSVDPQEVADNYENAKVAKLKTSAGTMDIARFKTEKEAIEMAKTEDLSVYLVGEDYVVALHTVKFSKAANKTADMKERYGDFKYIGVGRDGRFIKSTL